MSQLETIALCHNCTATIYFSLLHGKLQAGRL